MFSRGGHPYNEQYADTFKWWASYLTPGPSKLEKVVDPGSGPQGPLTEIGVHYLNLDFQRSPLVIKIEGTYLKGHHWSWIFGNNFKGTPQVIKIEGYLFASHHWSWIFENKVEYF